MNELTAFRFEEGQEVRTLERDGEPWFVAKDVAEALGYSEASISNIGDLIQNIPDEWKGRERFPTLGGSQEMLCLSEPGLYFFLNRSDKAAALPFQKWIAGEVIPSIRKTGRYALKGHPALTTPMSLEVYREVLNRANYVAEAQDNERKREIRAFFDEMVDFTCEEDDCITTKELYEACKAETATPLTRTMFAMRVREVFPGIGYKQKKVFGYPVPVFFGIKFRE